MSRTLLYTVQRVLEKLDLDAVNSINDSTDAVLVAREAETTFYDMMNRADWPEKNKLLALESVSDSTNPTALRLPDDVIKITSLRYDCTSSTDTSKVINKLQKLGQEDFLELVYSRASSDSDVFESTVNGRAIYIFTDTIPTYYTTFDNEYVVLDAYLSSIESTVQGNKSTCTGIQLDSWTNSDTFIIPLEKNLYTLYLSELTNTCALYLTGTTSAQDQKRADRAMSRMRRDSFRTEKLNKYRNYYGRNGNGLS